MHHSFTGNARKPRQVNLSGRPSANPWASLPGSSTKPGHAAGSNAAVALAQADRARRQQDRDKLTASRKVQKTWRGHASRRAQKAKWREEWDANEKARLGSASLKYANVFDSDVTSPSYPSQQDLCDQIGLLVRFQEYRNSIVRDATDTLRLLFLGRILQTSRPTSIDPLMRRRLGRLGSTAARHIKSVQSVALNGTDKRVVIRLAELIHFLTTMIPGEMAVSAILYMETLRALLDTSIDPTVQEAATTTIVGLLSTPSLQTYQAFSSILLGDGMLSQNLTVLGRFAWSIDHRKLLEALSSTSTGSPASAQIWQLTYLIWIEKQETTTTSLDERYEFVQVLSALLSSCANGIAERQGVLDMPMNAADSGGISPLPEFITDSLNIISEESAVREAIAVVSQHNGTAKTSDFDSARRFADYAVAMLRAFASNGEKARNIRKWLWQTSVTTTSGSNVSTLEYLWNSISNSKTFRVVSQNHRNVMSALREASPESNQIGKPTATAEEIAQWQSEWRIVLFFMELYSFVLKVIEDDEFFAGGDVANRDVDQHSNGSGRRGLAVKDVAGFAMFLKNLAFVLYWNAAELVPTTDAEELAALASLFGEPSGGGQPQIGGSPKTQLLTGNGVSHTYLKELTTSLLRMLHERDSRRQFVPASSWLMTNRVDMTGFISAVVDEEEKRHALTDDDDDYDADIEEDHSMSMSQSPRSMFAQLMSGSGGFNYSSATSRHSATERQKQQARKKRMIESLAPRLEILRNLPFFIPFDTRVQIFREFVYKDQLRRRGGHVDPDIWRMSVARNTMGRDIEGRAAGNDVISRQHAEVSRESVFEDAYASYYSLGDRLKEPIQISFIDKFGAPEAGIDGGGVTKEFLTSVTSEALDPTSAAGMFSENAQHYLYPNPLIWQETVESLRRSGIPEHSERWNLHLREFLRRFEFLGRVIGKCLYEGILIDVNFAGFFLLKWALTGGNSVATNESGYRASINDYREYDEEAYQGLLKLKYYPGNVEADFGLNFTVNDELRVQDAEGNESTIVKTASLLKDGGNKPVDNVWRHIYIDRLVKYRLQDQPEKVTNAFLRGLGQIISPSWLAMFNQKELQKLVGGDNTELDIADLRRNTLYGGLYVIGDDGLEHPTVELFWKAMQEMDDGDRRRVLKFVTSTPRAPLLGFSNLNPKFSIRDSSSDQTRLPSTSTCVNLLKLPRYSDLRTMKDKLMYAANAGAGFDLS